MRSLKSDGDAIFSPDERTAHFMALSSNGKTRIVPSEYDYVFLVGNGTGPQRFMGIRRSHRTFENNLSSLPLVSQALWREALKARMSKGYLHGMIKLIRDHSDVPILIIPDPMPSEQIVNCLDEGYLWRGEIGVTSAKQAREWLESFRGQRIDVSFQPSETLAAPHLTKSIFSEGSMRFEIDQAHSENEYFHMNAAFGEIVAKAAIALAELRAPAFAP
jgi:hypothetical protein